MKKEIFKTIRLEPFHQLSLLVYCSKDWNGIKKHLDNPKNKNINNWVKHLDLHLVKNLRTDAHIIVDLKTDQPFIFWIEDKKRDWTFYEGIIHEVIHIVDFLCKSKGVGQEEVEFRANLGASIFRKIRKTLDNFKD